MVLTLEVRHATFAYPGARDVLVDLDLAVEAGELLCLLGPNGCGKSTLLRCIAGLLRLGAGEVLLNGESLMALGRQAMARLIGYIPQEHMASFPYTALQVVVMGRAPHLGILATPSPKDVHLAEEAMAQVGISHLVDRRYTEISGGERQLVLIARVLAQHPAVLLMDEPTSHLDFGNQMRTLGIIRSLVEQQGLAVVMATHFPNHALLVADRVALMDQGTLLTVGEPVQVITEDALRTLYGVEVRMVAVDDAAPGRTAVMVPVLGSTRRPSL